MSVSSEAQSGVPKDFRSHLCASRCYRGTRNAVLSKRGVKPYKSTHLFAILLLESGKTAEGGGMPKSCSAYNCRSRYNRRNPNLTFHRFPLSKPSVLKEWLDNIGRGDFQPKKHTVICSHHFTPDCFSGLGNRRNLLWNAVPTLFSFQPPSPKTMESQKTLSTEKSQIPLKLLESQQEDVSMRHEHFLTEEATGAEPRQLNCVLQDLRATEHSYALAGPCAAKVRLFRSLHTIGWLCRRLKVKCRVIQKMRLQLRAARRELVSLRGQSHALARRESSLSAATRCSGLRSRQEEKHGSSGTTWRQHSSRRLCVR
ncbi:THAP domain-containing protein 3 [Paramormyrops kingsleyae]|uniref:THAP domain-containing protein 3 n=1 Tax=Paramormyrops kingsleyae TaxID=1676925 RepID=UPI003B97054E